MSRTGATDSAASKESRRLARRRHFGRAGIHAHRGTRGRRADLDRRRLDAQGLGAAGRTVLRAERSEVAIQQGAGGARPHADAPVRAARADLAARLLERSPDPGTASRTSLTIRPDLSEPFVTTPGEGETARVEPAPKDFAVGLGGATITGKLYRYVTWRDETCPLSLCEGGENTKRATVAVTHDPGDGAAPAVWVSTIVADPARPRRARRRRPAEARRRRPGHRTIVLPVRHALRAGTRQPQSGATRRTTRPPRAPRPRTTRPASNPDAGEAARPDGRERRRPATSSTPAVSSIVRPRRRLRRRASRTLDRGPSCAVLPLRRCVQRGGTQASGACTRGAPRSCRSPSTLDGLGDGLALHHHRRGRAAAGRLCATLLDRQTAERRSTDRVLGTAVYDLSSWPTTSGGSPSASGSPQAETVPAGHRLGAGAARPRRVGRRHLAPLRPPPLPVAARGGDHHPAMRCSRPHRTRLLARSGRSRSPSRSRSCSWSWGLATVSLRGALTSQTQSCATATSSGPCRPRTRARGGHVPDQPDAAGLAPVRHGPASAAPDRLPLQADGWCAAQSEDLGDGRRTRCGSPAAIALTANGQALSSARWSRRARSNGVRRRVLHAHHGRHRRAGLPGGYAGVSLDGLDVGNNCRSPAALGSNGNIVLKNCAVGLRRRRRPGPASRVRIQNNAQRLRRLLHARPPRRASTSSRWTRATRRPSTTTTRIGNPPAGTSPDPCSVLLSIDWNPSTRVLQPAQQRDADARRRRLQLLPARPRQHRAAQDRGPAARDGSQDLHRLPGALRRRQRNGLGVGANNSSIVNMNTDPTTLQLYVVGSPTIATSVDFSNGVDLATDMIMAVYAPILDRHAAQQRAAHRRDRGAVARPPEQRHAHLPRADRRHHERQPAPPLPYGGVQGVRERPGDAPRSTPAASGSVARPRPDRGRAAHRLPRL